MILPGTDYLNACIYVADRPSPTDLAAAANIAARLAFEAHSMDLPGLAISAYRGDDASIAIVVGVAAADFTGGGSRKVMLLPDPADAEQFARTLGTNIDTEERTERMADFPTIVLGPDSHDIEVINIAARIALEATELRLPLVVVGTAAGPMPPLPDSVSKSADAPNLRMQPGPLLFEDSYELPWEVDDAFGRLEETVLPAIHAGSVVEVELRISESPEIRAVIAQKIRSLAQLRGANHDKLAVRVIAAHKQAYTWIDEILKPQLRQASHLRIFYRELGPEKSPVVESPQRWLQELYPIDEILSRDLGIPLDNITFHKASSISDVTYQVIARDFAGKTILDESFTPRSVLCPMFDSFPDYSQVRVSTGWLYAIVDDAVVADERIKTDPEKFWTSYQSALRGLPKIAEHVPRLGTLEVDAWLSEPDYRIGIDEERISTLEALHEDIYFETLLYFELIGLKNPPRVIPRVHRARDGEGGTVRIRITGQGMHAFAAIPQIEPLPITDEPMVQTESPIGPDECEHIVRRLAAYPEVKAFCAGTSYLGRSIWALELTAPSPGKYVSQARASVIKPTIFITGRQHANEVSSTTHILLLAESLVTDPEIRKLLDHVNFILQPMTNPDGAALLEELHNDTPDFMLHAAYWGALGRDVTHDQWSDDPQYPEARVRPALWRKWQPDIVLNPHGYPSHEWVQMFAGYTAWVKSRDITARDWWIPRGWFIPRFDYMEETRDAAFAFRDHVMRAMNNTLGPWHERMQQRHSKYGALPSPSTIPEKGLEPDANAFTFMQRHPHVTFMEIVTEAPDEVAHGDWLKTLALTGLEFSLASARWLATNCKPVVRTVEHTANTTTLRITRKRP